MRWKNLRDWHEMYCAGHLMEAAVAHYQATGNPKLLDALCRYADHIDREFGPNPGQRRGYCGHPEIELALVRLYHATGEKRYLELSKYMVEERGQSNPHYYDMEAVARGEDPRQFHFRTYEYCQAHAPIREQGKVVGHAVRAMYLMSGVADLAAEYDDPTLLAACERLWDNLVHQRMYLTGGIGPSGQNEGFTFDYDLPDETAYAETCAAIALIMWNHRLLQFAGDGRYADIIEQTLYNGFISGVSLDGTHFFYVNPLASTGDHHRTPWFECPCCPPNLGRILASLGNYLYSTSDSGLWVHLFAQNAAKVTIDGQPVDLRLTSNYPWDGEISLAITPAQPQRFALHLRVPGWCQEWQVTVNGERVTGLAPVNGYIAIERTWQARRQRGTAPGHACAGSLCQSQRASTPGAAGAPAWTCRLLHGRGGQWRRRPGAHRPGPCDGGPVYGRIPARSPRRREACCAAPGASSTKRAGTANSFTATTNHPRWMSWMLWRYPTPRGTIVRRAKCAFGSAWGKLVMLFSLSPALRATGEKNQFHGIWAAQSAAQIPKELYSFLYLFAPQRSLRLYFLSPDYPGTRKAIHS